MASAKTAVNKLKQQAEETKDVTLSKVVEALEAILAEQTPEEPKKKKSKSE